MPPTPMKSVVCAGCGCDCDDIYVHADGRPANACPLGEAWFRGQLDERPSPAATIYGRDATLGEAVAAAAGLLQRADRPLVFGLGRATCEAQREAVALAERLGGVLDTDTSLTHGPMELAAQLGGKVTCTLGEIKNRADLVLYWGANPVESHPRHFERYTLAAGRHTPNGRADRTLVVADVRDTPSTAAADVFLRVRPGTDFEALSVLRAVVQGSRFDPAGLAASGLTVGQLRDLAERMTRARYGIVFVGPGLFRTRGGFMNCAAVTALVVELNARTRFVAMPMRTPGNVAGADAVLTYTAGYPFAVDYSRGYPRYGPGEFSAADVLARGEADAAVVIGADSLARLSAAARDHLARVPTILLDAKAAPFPVSVHVRTATAAAGTVYRMDRVPLPLRPAAASALPSDEAVLRAISDQVAEEA